MKKKNQKARQLNPNCGAADIVLECETIQTETHYKNSHSLHLSVQHKWREINTEEVHVSAFSFFFGFMICKSACVKVYVREKTGSVFGCFPHQFCMKKYHWSKVQISFHKKKTKQNLVT